jgi:hypothetical protein
MRSRKGDTASRRKCAIVGRNARKRAEREAGRGFSTGLESRRGTNCGRATPRRDGPDLMA